MYVTHIGDTPSQHVVPIVCPPRTDFILSTTKVSLGLVRILFIEYLSFNPTAATSVAFVALNLFLCVCAAVRSRAPTEDPRLAMFVSKFIWSMTIIQCCAPLFIEYARTLRAEGLREQCVRMCTQ